MKRLFMLMAVSGALAACGSKGWNANTEKQFLDKCMSRGALVTKEQCDCELGIYKKNNILPDQIETTKNLSVSAELLNCTVSGTGGLLNNIGNVINNVVSTVDSTIQNVTNTVNDVTKKEEHKGGH